jgi:hypothetical protein
MTPDLMGILQRLRNRVVEAAYALLCLCTAPGTASVGNSIIDLDAAFSGSAEDLGGRDGEGEDVGTVGGIDGVGGEVLFGLEGGKGLVARWMDGWMGGQ